MEYVLVKWVHPLTVANAGNVLPQRYWNYLRRWVALGVVAFLSLVAAFYLMVAKPMSLG